MRRDVISFWVGQFLLLYYGVMPVIAVSNFRGIPIAAITFFTVVIMAIVCLFVTARQYQFLLVEYVVLTVVIYSICTLIDLNIPSELGLLIVLASVSFLCIFGAMGALRWIVLMIKRRWSAR